MPRATKKRLTAQDEERLRTHLRTANERRAERAAALEAWNAIPSPRDPEWTVRERAFERAREAEEQAYRSVTIVLATYLAVEMEV